MFVIHLLKFVKKMLFPAHLPFLQEKTAIYMIQKIRRLVKPLPGITGLTFIVGRGLL
jgi:hypothetical protein